MTSSTLDTQPETEYKELNLIIILVYLIFKIQWTDLSSFKKPLQNLFLVSIPSADIVQSSWVY